MLELIGFKKDYYELIKETGLNTIIYGSLEEFMANRDNMPKYELFFDRDADSEKKVDGETVYGIKELKELSEPVIVLVCIVGGKRFIDACDDLKKYGVEGYAVHFFNNITFVDNFWSSSNSYRVSEIKPQLKVNIVCRDTGWIFRKFAEKIESNLAELGVDARITDDPDEKADINHHIPYVFYKPFKNDTLMITHVDTSKKVDLLKKQLETAALGICMSKDTVDKLSMWGVPREKLCYVNPAHDHLIKPHKYVIGITHKCHDGEDVRKRATALLDVIEGVKPDYFQFKIMGGGWNAIVKEMRNRGFEVELHDNFDLKIYTQLMSTIDYFLYMGFDEGTMGYLDALYAGAGTIVTPQGYHLDMGRGIDYPCNTISEFHEAFMNLQNKRQRIVDSVEEYTWRLYTEKLLTIWKFILKQEPITEIFKNQSKYMDGIFSVLPEENRL